MSSNSSLTSLTLIPDDPYNTTLTSTNGQIVYIVSTKLERNSASTLCRVTSVTDGYGQDIGKFIRPSHRGSDLVCFGNEPAQKMSSWMASHIPFSSSMGKFKHNGAVYKWIRQNDNGNTTLQLHTNDPTSPNPIASFTDSRRDWSFPNDLIIQKAKLEVTLSATTLLDLCVFSLIVVEIKRRARSPPAVMSLTDAEGRAQMMGQLALFSGGY